METCQVTARAIKPLPIKAMGRFMPEAAAVDPATGIVYLTKDEPCCLFYHGLPNAKGELVKGGRLQTLSIRGHHMADLRNWPVDSEPSFGGRHGQAGSAVDGRLERPGPG
jgi:hypothetical protein